MISPLPVTPHALDVGAEAALVALNKLREEGGFTLNVIHAALAYKGVVIGAAIHHERDGAEQAIAITEHVDDGAGKLVLHRTTKGFLHMKLMLSPASRTVCEPRYAALPGRR